MVNESTLQQLLAPFAVELSSAQATQLLTYLDLLIRWNERINLTAINTPEECVTRHFGESLYLSRRVKLNGKLLDIGTGAGFPGLALKIMLPQLAVVLLEPVAKKRAFLKEVARACGMESVEVRAERLREFQSRLQKGRAAQAVLFDAATARAVGNLGDLVPQAAHCLRSAGHLYLWLSHDQAEKLVEQRSRSLGPSQSFFKWEEPIAVPLSRQREIWCGIRKDRIQDS